MATRTATKVMLIMMIKTTITNLQEVLSRLSDQQAGVNSIHDQVQEVYNTTIYLYRYQQYIVEKDFVRAADAMSERTFRVVASGMQEFVNKVRSVEVVNKVRSVEVVNKVRSVEVVNKVRSVEVC